jgi:molecular chaperone Hsp33
VLAGSVRAGELTDRELPLDDLLWRLFHEEAEVRAFEPIRLSRGCRCDPDYVRSVIARCPAEDREAMVGDDGLIRVDCAFCSHSFPIALEDVS